MGFEVVGIGAVAVDTLVFVDQPLTHGKGRVLRTERRYGGNVATALAAASALGRSTAFLGSLPDPQTWADVHDDLTTLNVDISHATAVHGSGEPPILSTVLVGADGDRFIAFDDATSTGTPTSLDLTHIRDANVVLLDAYAASGAAELVHAARAAGTQVVADLEFDADGTHDLVDTVDHLVLPLGFAGQLATTTDPTEIVNALWNPHRRAVVLTDGTNGCWYRTHDDPTVRRYPAIPVHVVDTTGCGDVFHGAYCAALAQQLPITECIAHATAAAAICATGVGGRGHLPTPHSINELLGARTPTPISTIDPV